MLHSGLATVFAPSLAVYTAPNLPVSALWPLLSPHATLSRVNLRTPSKSFSLDELAFAFRFAGVAPADAASVAQVRAEAWLGACTNRVRSWSPCPRARPRVRLQPRGQAWTRRG
jgi:hypothetical protein